MKKQQYIEPEMWVLELKLRNQLLEASPFDVNEEETDEQW